MEVIIEENRQSASRLAARKVIQFIQNKPDAVLGFPTGATPQLMYKELIEAYRQGEVSFASVTAFNLDEYVGLPAEHPMSYAFYMRECFFNHVDISPDKRYIPDGMSKDIPASCLAYEEQIRSVGGIDLQILGLGADGHIGFNEPSSSLSSRTRIKTLAESTRNDNARYFDSLEQVPRHCLTMGLGTIMESKSVLLLAFGDSKSSAVAAAIEGGVSASCPASVLQFHPKTVFILDEASGAKLIRKSYYKSVYAGKPDWQKDSP